MRIKYITESNLVAYNDPEGYDIVAASSLGNAEMMPPEPLPKDPEEMQIIIPCFHCKKKLVINETPKSGIEHYHRGCLDYLERIAPEAFKNMNVKRF